MKKIIAIIMEWVRPAGIVAVYFIAGHYGTDAGSTFHILGPLIVVIMSGSVAFESLVLGPACSEKIGYKPDRPYQIQSGLNNLATAVTALLVFLLDWGIFADATVVIAMLIFFTLSAGNHALTAIKQHDLKPANLMRPIMTLVLLALLLPSMLNALAGV
jgi:hypothetical protein